MRLLSSAADGGEAWDDLGELTEASIINLGYARVDVAQILGLPVGELAHVLLEGGSVALADQVIRLLELRIADLTWVVKDLRATRDVALARDRLTGGLLP